MGSDDVREKAEALIAVIDQTPVYGTRDIPADAIDRREAAQFALRAALAVAPATAQPWAWAVVGGNGAKWMICDREGAARQVAETWNKPRGRNDYGPVQPCSVVPLYAAPPATGDAAAVRHDAAEVARRGAVVAYEQMADPRNGWTVAHTYADCMEAVGKALDECEAMIRALPLPAPATAVEEARKAFYEAARDFWITASSPARTATHGPAAISRLNAAGTAILAAEAAATHAAKGGV